MKKVLQSAIGKVSVVLVVLAVLAPIVNAVKKSFPWPQVIASSLLLIVIAVVLVLRALKYANMTQEEKWQRWDPVHGQTDQLRRIERALQETYNIKTFDEINGSAVFIGGGGKYKTNLLKCSCPDFKKRKLPCKHMYKIAYDLGLMGQPSENSIL